MPDGRQHAFVVMSFHEEDAAAFKEGIRPAVEALGIAALRVDHEHFTGRVTDQIVDRLKRAYFVVAEMSRQRPNCYYEVGFAQALGRPVIMLIDDAAKIHFDIRDFPFIVYSDHANLQQQLKERILGAVLQQRDTPSDADPRCGKFGGFAVQDGRLLTATINSTKKTKTELTLRVVALPGGNPLSGRVRFYLHDTYDPASHTVTVRNGEATLEIDAEGAFTVGAKADNDMTRLELNLMTIPGAHPAFYGG
jgi:nucleoside 2-deoxyribosyltransferase